MKANIKGLDRVMCDEPMTSVACKSSVDGFFKCETTKSMGAKASSCTLCLTKIKSLGGQVNSIGDKGYKIKGLGRLSVVAFTNLLKQNNDIDVRYPDGIDNNEMIEKTKEPLWNVSKDINGDFVLQRNF